MYPGNHNVTSDCWWVVQVPQGQTIQLRWDTFNVHRRLEAGGCDGNYVEVVDGLNTGSVRRLIPRLEFYLLIICFDYTNFVQILRSNNTSGSHFYHKYCFYPLCHKCK